MSQRRLDACHDRTPLAHLWLTGAGLWACIYGGASEHGATPERAWYRALGLKQHGDGWWMPLGKGAVRAASPRDVWRLWLATRAVGDGRRGWE